MASRVPGCGLRWVVPSRRSFHTVKLIPRARPIISPMKAGDGNGHQDSEASSSTGNGGWGGTVERGHHDPRPAQDDGGPGSHTPEDWAQDGTPDPRGTRSRNIVKEVLEISWSAPAAAIAVKCMCGTSKVN